MSDLISRSAFREKIVDMMNAYPISCQVLRELDKFPTVDAKPVDWIPCNEMLPQTDGRFEVTIKGSKGKRHVEMCNFHKNAKFTPWGLGNWEHGNVIAWRQRSEPYNADMRGGKND